MIHQCLADINMIYFQRNRQEQLIFLKEQKMSKLPMVGESKLPMLAESKANLSLSILNESTNQTIEREIDNYTRLLQQQKRKFIRVQESGNEIIGAYSKKLKELEALKSRQQKTDFTKKKGEVKILQRELNQAITSYNEALAYNNNVKSQIDELRKEKRNEQEAHRALHDRIAQLNKEIQERSNFIAHSTEQITHAKLLLLQMKKNNQSQMKSYQKEVSAIRNAYEYSEHSSHCKRKESLTPSTQTIDTQPLVKIRLRNIINQNKEKIKIIESYKKTMNIIYQNFQEIKLQSGLSQLSEVIESFSKHQKQNMFVYHYISKLTKEIEELTQGNSLLKNQIQDQKRKNDVYYEEIIGTPEREQRKLNIEQSNKEKKETINNLNKFLQEVESEIMKTVEGYGELNQSNIAEYLAAIEELVHKQIHLPTAQINEIKEEHTRYTKCAPSLGEEFKEGKEEKILEEGKLREFAEDFWEHKKTKSKNNEE